MGNFRRKPGENPVISPCHGPKIVLRWKRCLHARDKRPAGVRGADVVKNRI
ncbi:hypothetical protein CLOSTASPAR_02920 [[Clostridium] asparagiforme DSM 15981]|uniref:Uncharacterized protein n=1 Tax=[Clostridium] asparagiforme DSM 15981 TaxID=518636 RepID=C0D0Y3_9FIRM|nr:hypothetical protein CLOSTASPAR_02920 [[Clostridium] asparagiforme DSM 15981]